MHILAFVVGMHLNKTSQAQVSLPLSRAQRGLVVGAAIRAFGAIPEGVLRARGDSFLPSFLSGEQFRQRQR